MPYDYSKGRYVHTFPKWDKTASLSSIEKNLMTFAQSRSGKGTTQIIPFLLDSDDINALVVDPKGEAAEATADYRAKQYGQKAHILDPFHTTRFAKEKLATYNPLDHIDPSNRASFRQINALADGLIMRHSKEAGHWDDGAKQVLAGFIAHVVSHPNYEGRRSLPTMRKLLTATGEAFGAVVDEMAQNPACGGLAQSCANKLLNTGSEAGHFISGATSNTVWLDDPDMADFLSSSSFKLADLKTDKCDVFLVLPFDALDDYGRFLRLFVRMAIYHMQQKLPNGDLKGRNTFFILDEFFSLGHIEQIAKSIGGMPGFNMHLWPFLQDYPQLLQLYDNKAAGTFIANCEAVFFYGVNDPDTAEYVSKGAGLIQEHELGVKPPTKPTDASAPRQYVRNKQDWGFFEEIFGGEETEAYKQWKIANVPPVAGRDFINQQPEDISDEMRKHLQAKAELEARKQQSEARYQDAMNQYGHARNCVGQPRVTPDEVMQITKKNPSRGIADFALVLQDGVCWKAPLTAYFERKKREAKKPTRPKTANQASSPQKQWQPPMASKPTPTPQPVVQSAPSQKESEAFNGFWVSMLLVPVLCVIFRQPIAQGLVDAGFDGRISGDTGAYWVTGFTVLIFATINFFAAKSLIKSDNPQYSQEKINNLSWGSVVIFNIILWFSRWFF